MAAHLKISNANAEAIGRPLFDNVIQSFVDVDRDAFITHFPYLDTWMTVEIFDEAVEVLRRLGKLLTSEFSNHSISNNGHSLVWDVTYQNDENCVHWTLHLDDAQETIKVTGFSFDR